MSRAKAKLAKMQDLQCRQPDFIFTKKDCDMIAEALLKQYEWNEIRGMYNYFKGLGRL